MTDSNQSAVQTVGAFRDALVNELVHQGTDVQTAAALVDEVVNTVIDEAAKSGEPPGLGLSPDVVAALSQRMEAILAQAPAAGGDDRRSPEQASDSDVVAEQQRIQDHN